MASGEDGSSTNELNDERDAWIKQNQSIQPLRRFWWEGFLYARFDRNAKFLDELAWHLLSVSEWEAAARKVEPGRTHRFSSDHMEVFCSPKQGRIVSR